MLRHDQPAYFEDLRHKFSRLEEADQQPDLNESLDSYSNQSIYQLFDDSDKETAPPKRYSLGSTGAQAHLQYDLHATHQLDLHEQLFIRSQQQRQQRQQKLLAEQQPAAPAVESHEAQSHEAQAGDKGKSGSSTWNSSTWLRLLTKRVRTRADSDATPESKPPKGWKPAVSVVKAVVNLRKLRAVRAAKAAETAAAIAAANSSDGMALRRSNEAMEEAEEAATEYVVAERVRRLSADFGTAAPQQGGPPPAAFADPAMFRDEHVQAFIEECWVAQAASDPSRAALLEGAYFEPLQPPQPALPTGVPLQAVEHASAFAPLAPPGHGYHAQVQAQPAHMMVMPSPMQMAAAPMAMGPPMVAGREPQYMMPPLPMPALVRAPNSTPVLPWAHPQHAPVPAPWMAAHGFPTQPVPNMDRSPPMPPPMPRPMPMPAASSPTRDGSPPTASRLEQMARDRDGSIELQQRLQRMGPGELCAAVAELRPHLASLATHAFGNYLISTMASLPAAHGALHTAMRGRVVALSQHPQGSRAIQAVLEALPQAQAEALVRELSGRVAEVSCSTHGSWSVVAAYKASHAPFVVSELAAGLTKLSTQQNGSRVVQRVMAEAATAHADVSEIVGAMLGLEEAALVALAADRFANYVVQLALRGASTSVRTQLVDTLLPHAFSSSLSESKCGSNVAETLIELASAAQLAAARDSLAPEQAAALRGHQFGKYVMIALDRRTC